MKKIIFIIFLLFSTQLVSDDKVTNTTIKQYDYWSLKCEMINNDKNCQAIQTIKTNETNFQFTIIYQKFLNEKKIEKEIIQFITPLGVNLNIKPAILFDKDPQINLEWTKCEPFGCIAILTNNTEINETVKVFNKVKNGLKKSKEMQLGIQGFNTEPLVVKFSLKGFIKVSSLIVGIKNKDI
mgnify:FL=1